MQVSTVLRVLPISLRTDTFFSFLLHFTGKWPCRYPKTPAASLFSASNLQEKASKWCNQSPPAQKLDPNYVKNSVKSPCFPSPFRQTFRCLTHTHTHTIYCAACTVFYAPRPSPDVGWCEVWFEFPRAQSNTTRQPMLGHLGPEVSEPIQRFHWELYSNIMHDSMHSISHTIHRTGIFIYISVDFYGK